MTILVSGEQTKQTKRMKHTSSPMSTLVTSGSDELKKFFSFLDSHESVPRVTRQIIETTRRRKGGSDSDHREATTTATATALHYYCYMPYQHIRSSVTDTNMPYRHIRSSVGVVG